MVLTLWNDHSRKPTQTKRTMKNKNNKLLTMLAVAGIYSVAASSANAATLTLGDLILGFRVSTAATQGFGTDLLVRAGATGATGIGNAVDFRDATSSISSVVDIGGELSSLYGADWASRSDLSWGVVGVRSASASANGTAGNGNTPARSPFIGIAQTANTPGVANSNAASLSSGTDRSATSNRINSINSSFSSGTDTGISGVEAVQTLSSTSGLWTSQQSESFLVGGGGLTEASSTTGIDDTGLDLYWILDRTVGALDNGVAPTALAGQGIWQGSFQISNSGVVSFNTAAVPEPSRALLAGLGLVGLLFRRRRA
jgi:hypothetical protein